MAQELFASWELVNEHRMARHGRSFRNSGFEPVPLQPSIVFFRSNVRRNHSRSRHRYLRARSFPTFPVCEVWEGEQHLVDPSDDEDIPAALPGVHLDLPEHFSLPLACMNPRVTAQSVKRPGGPVDMGSNKEQRTE